MVKLEQKILNAIENWRLKLESGQRNWYNYIISIQELSIERNNKNWFIIDILDIDWNFLERVNLDIRPVFEFWCGHNKIFLS